MSGCLTCLGEGQVTDPDGLYWAPCPEGRYCEPPDVCAACSEVIPGEPLVVGDATFCSEECAPGGTLTGDLVAYCLELRAERDRARATAVHLEQQLAAVAALHVRDETPTAPFPFCMTCGEDWPCMSAQALGVEP